MGSYPSVLPLLSDDPCRHLDRGIMRHLRPIVPTDHTGGGAGTMTWWVLFPMKRKRAEVAVSQLPSSI